MKNVRHGKKLRCLLNYPAAVVRRPWGTPVLGADRFGELVADDAA